MKEALQIHDLFLCFQRRRRLIARARGIGAEQVSEQLGFAEESILQVLYSSGPKNVKELSEVIKLERSWASRVIAGLVQQKLIAASTPSEDRRSKRLELTALGARSLEGLTAVVNEITEALLEPLSAAEAKEFTSLVQKLADGLGASKALRAGSTHPLHVQLGRLSRALGVFGSSLIGSEFSNTQMQILSCMQLAEGRPVLLTDLCQLLPFDLSTVSRTVAGLEKSGYLKKVQSEHDRRSSDIALTKRGGQALLSYRSQVEKFLKESLNGFSATERSELIELLERICGESFRRERNLGSERIQVRRAEDAESRRELAGLQKRLTKTSRPARGDYKCEAIGCYLDGELHGVAQVIRSEHSGLVKQIVLVAEEADAEQYVDFVRKALEKAAG